jgi:hypothetical protein
MDLKNFDHILKSLEFKFIQEFLFIIENQHSMLIDTLNDHVIQYGICFQKHKEIYIDNTIQLWSIYFIS